MLFDGEAFEPWPAVDQQNDTTTAARWRVVARGMEGGQGTTDAYHTRTDVVFDAETAGVRRRKGQASGCGASNTEATSTANPSSSREAAAAPRPHAPCSAYAPPPSASTVIAAWRGSTIQYSGMPASA